MSGNCLKISEIKYSEATVDFDTKHAVAYCDHLKWGSTSIISLLYRLTQFYHQFTNQLPINLQTSRGVTIHRTIDTSR